MRIDEIRIPLNLNPELVEAIQKLNSKMATYRKRTFDTAAYETLMNGFNSSPKFEERKQEMNVTVDNSTIHLHQDGETFALKQQLQDQKNIIRKLEDRLEKQENTTHNIKMDRDSAEETLRSFRWELGEVFDALYDLGVLYKDDKVKDVCSKTIRVLKNYGCGGRQLPAKTIESLISG